MNLREAQIAPTAPDFIARATALHGAQTLVDEIERIAVAMIADYTAAFRDETSTPIRIHDETRAHIDDLVDAVRRWTGEDQ